MADGQTLSDEAADQTLYRLKARAAIAWRMSRPLSQGHNA